MFNEQLHKTPISASFCLFDPRWTIVNGTVYSAAQFRYFRLFQTSSLWPGRAFLPADNGRMRRAVFKPFRSFSRRADQQADGMSAELERKVEAKEKKNVKKAKGPNEKKKTEVRDTGVETKGEDNHEIGILYARELGISEEFVLRMVEAFAYFDKVLIIILI